MQCEQCGFENPKGMRFCGQCATPLNRLCPNCGSSNPANFDFCGQCAHSLTGAQSTDNVRPNTDPQHTSNQEDAERRQLTVLFCDIVNSSALSANIDPEDLRDIMREYRATCSEIVSRYDGHVAQHLGDGILVYFGYPHAHEDDAHRAVYTALEIIERIRQICFPQENSEDIQLAVRVGIHTGLVVIGEIGGGDKRALALGETPNIAARIQDHADTNTLIISDATHKLIGESFDSNSLGDFTLKGFTQALELFQITKVRNQYNRLIAARTLSRTTLVGRDQETSLLLEKLKQARKGIGQVVLLSGEPGLGKTRMVQMVCESIPEEQCTLLECAGTPYFQNSFLHPIIEMVSRAIGIDDNASDPENISRIEKMVATLGMDSNIAIPALADLLSIPLNNHSSVDESTPQHKKQLIMDTLVETLQSMARQRLVLFIIEDLQWLDPSTLELLSQLVSQAGLTNIFALFTFRSEFHSPWQTQANLTTITLNHLTQQQSGSLIRQLSHQKFLPMDVFSEIINKTDGIPYFVEELTRTVLRSELLIEKEGHFELSKPMKQLGIPTTLQDSLMSKLDSLGKNKELAQLASILGREFDYELLSALSTDDTKNLQMNLNQLINAELFFQRGTPPDSQYNFRHALLCETAYQSLLKRTRQKYHQQVANLLKSDFPVTLIENPELMAHHCTEAGNFSESLTYWLEAGHRAINRSANVEAVALLSTGISIIEKLPNTAQRQSTELSFQTSLGLAETMCKGYAAPEVEKAYARAKELCHDINHISAIFPVLCGLWEYHIVRADHNTSLKLASEIQKKAAQANTAELTLETERIMGTTHFWRGQLTDALQHFELHEKSLHETHSSQEKRVSHCQDAKVATLANTSCALWLLGYPDQALDKAEQALNLAKRLSHPFSQAYALQFLASVHQLRGDRLSVNKYAEAQIILSDTYGFPFWKAIGTMMHAWANTGGNSAEAACEICQEGLKEYEASGNKLARSYFHSLQADLQKNAGLIEPAKKTIDIALKETDQSGEKYFTAELLRLKGELISKTLDNNNFQIAESIFNEASEYSIRQNSKSLSLRIAMNITNLRNEQKAGEDKIKAAYSKLSTCLSSISEGSNTTDIITAHKIMDNHNP
jgi:predicted ATPase/class 3 adenylate cyclase